MLANGERQVAPELSGIRRDHVARYEWAASLLAPGSRVIDLACGVGYGSAILFDVGAHSVLALDRSEEAIAYARAHYNGRASVIHEVMDVSALELSSTFDAAVCFETIEHLADPLPMLRELCRSAPRLIASVPNETVFPHGGRIKFHYRHYTREQFQALLERAGYQVTEWWGQEGPYSEVERDREGRTLIAVATRREVPTVFEESSSEIVKPGAFARALKESELRPLPARPVPDHVCIVGLGPSCELFFELTRRLGGVSAWCDELWGINQIGDCLRCDRVFHMDDVKVQEVRALARPDSNIAAMVKWLKRHPGPVYTSIAREGYPGLVAFPLEEVLNARHDSNGAAPYFNSTAAYAIAYAIHIGVKRISCFGLDYTLPNAHHGEQGRACCEFWLGVAAARGIEITLPETTTLMDACERPERRLYGYDCVDVRLVDQEGGGVKVAMTERQTLPTAAEIEARYDHSQHPNTLIRRGSA